MKKMLLAFLLAVSAASASDIYPPPAKWGPADLASWSQPRIASGTALPAVASAATGDLFVLKSSIASAGLYLMQAGAWWQLGSSFLGDKTFASGTVTFESQVAIATDCWDDINVQVTGVNLAGGGTNAPSVDITEDIGALTFSGTAGTTVDMAAILQLPHTFRPGDIVAHIHTKNLTAGNGTATWELWYKFADAGEAFPATYTVATLSYTVPAATTTHQINSFGAIDASSLGDSAIICFMLRRIVADSSTTDINLISFDVHYKKNRLGSSEQNGHR